MATQLVQSIGYLVEANLRYDRIEATGNEVPVSPKVVSARPLMAQKRHLVHHEQHRVDRGGALADTNQRSAEDCE